MTLKPPIDMAECDESADRDVSRSKHPTDLAVPTTLTVEELDFVIGFYTDDDPVTVRSMLSDACRQVIGVIIADLVESGKIPASMD